MGKGEIALYEQFLLFPQCFQKACFPGASKGVIVWERVNSLPNQNYLEWTKFKAFADDKCGSNKDFCLHRVTNIVEKRENAGYQHFSPFSTVFSKCLSSCVKSLVCVIRGYKGKNDVGEGENVNYQPFPLFPQCFQKASFQGMDFTLKGQYILDRCYRRCH